MQPAKLFHRTYINGFYWPFMSLCYSLKASEWRATKAGKFFYVDLASKEVTKEATMETRPRRPNAVRVVCLSDTHEAHHYVDVPEGDVLLHCGDLFFQDRGEMGSRARLKGFNDFLGTLSHPRKFIIGGNHDQVLEDLGPEEVQEVLTNATYLQDSGATLEEFGGIRIYGLPASPNGGSGNKAFQRKGRSQDLQEVWDRIPANVDILMTHGSGDLLAREIERKRPAVHVCGHLHGGHGAWFDDHTTAVNAAIMDSSYFPTQLPVVFDYVIPQGRDL